MTLEAIRKKNRNPKSFLNIEMKEVVLSKEDYELGRKFLKEVIEPLGCEVWSKLKD